MSLWGLRRCSLVYVSQPGHKPHYSWWNFVSSLSDRKPSTPPLAPHPPAGGGRGIMAGGRPKRHVDQKSSAGGTSRRQYKCEAIGT